MNLPAGPESGTSKSPVEPGVKDFLSSEIVYTNRIIKGKDSQGKKTIN